MSEEKDLETTEETVDETVEGEEETTEGTETEVVEEKEKTDVKEQNRKGFEIRQQNKEKKESVINTLSKRLEEAEAKLNAISETSKDSDWRKSHPDVSDELFNLIKSASKGSGKSYDDSLDDPVIKSVIETSKSKSRIESSTPAPSTKTSAPGSNKISDMSSEEFKAYQEEVLRRG